MDADETNSNEIQQLQEQIAGLRVSFDMLTDDDMRWEDCARYDDWGGEHWILGHINLANMLDELAALVLEPERTHYQDEVLDAVSAVFAPFPVTIFTRRYARDIFAMALVDQGWYFIQFALRRREEKRAELLLAALMAFKTALHIYKRSRPLWGSWRFRAASNDDNIARITANLDTLAEAYQHATQPALQEARLRALLAAQGISLAE